MDEIVRINVIPNLIIALKLLPNSLTNCVADRFFSKLALIKNLIILPNRRL